MVTSQVEKIRNEKEVITDTTEIERIIRDRYKQLYTINWTARKEQTSAQHGTVFQDWDRREEIADMSRPITSDELKLWIKKIPTNKSSEPDGFRGKFYQTFKEELTCPSETIPKISEKGTLPSSFYEATITLIQKPDKDITKKKITGQFTDEHECKNPQKKP